MPDKTAVSPSIKATSSGMQEMFGVEQLDMFSKNVRSEKDHFSSLIESASCCSTLIPLTNATMASFRFCKASARS